MEVLTTNTIDLTKFCGELPTAFTGIDKPYIVGNWKYATDTRICIRIPIDNEVESPVAEVLKVAERFFDNFPDDSQLVDYPTGDEGVTSVKCGECGTIKVIHRDISGCRLSQKNDALLRSLSNVRIETAEPGRNKLLFTFEGGQGVVMSMRKD